MHSTLQCTHISKSALASLWRRVSIPEDEEQCWEWSGAINSSGMTSINVKGLPASAHRAVYSLVVGPIPSGVRCYHKCENKTCVNPWHLSIGNHPRKKKEHRKGWSSPTKPLPFIRPQDEERFGRFAGVAVAGRCQEWQGHRQKSGYGIFWLGGKGIYAHRVAYAIAHGDPGDLHIRHTCGNRGCVSPIHLLTGTNADNSADTKAMGRSRNQFLGSIPEARKPEGHKGIGFAPPAERFWSLVDMSGGPDACWPRKGHVDRDGYGHFYSQELSPLKPAMVAHHVPFILNGQSIPEGMMVRHLCNNPPCVNPAHLRIGTYQENAWDRELRFSP